MNCGFPFRGLLLPLRFLPVPTPLPSCLSPCRNSSSARSQLRPRRGTGHTARARSAQCERALEHSTGALLPREGRAGCPLPSTVHGHGELNPYKCREGIAGPGPCFGTDAAVPLQGCGWCDPSADPPSNSVCLQPWHCRKRLWYFRFLPVRNVRSSAPATKTDHRGGAGTQSPELFLAQTLSCQNCLGGGTTHPGAPAKQEGQGRKIWASSKAERTAAAETRPPALQLEQDGEEKAFLI